jgi:phage-related holin
MIAETSLTESRDELKQQLTEGEYKSSIDVILDAMGRILQKLTRRSNLPTYWQSAIAITILFSMIGYLSSILAGGVSPELNRTIVFAGAMFFLNLVITKSIFDRAFATLQDKLLDALESNAGLSGIHGWLVAAGDIKRPPWTSRGL